MRLEMKRTTAAQQKIDVLLARGGTVISEDVNGTVEVEHNSRIARITSTALVTWRDK